MIRSLRARLMLVSAGLSGAVLAAFAAWTYARLYDAGLHEIDGQLRHLGSQFLLKPNGAEQSSELDRALALLSRSTTGQAHLMLVIGRGSETIAQSAYWPADLSKDEFEAPPEQPRPPDRRPPRNELGQAPPPGDPRRDDFRPPPPRDGFDPGRPPPRDEFDPDRPPPRDEIDPGRSPLGGQPDPNRFGPPGDRRPPPGPRPGGRAENLRPGDPRGMPPGDRRPPRNDPPYPPPLRTPLFSSRTLDDGTWRIAALGAPHAALVAGIRLDSFQQDMANLRTGFLGASALALVGIVLGAWAVANQALAPLRRLSRAIEGVSARGLNQRVLEDTRDPDLRQLTQQFNAMMGRLEGSFSQAVRFSADAAHELKTPLSILQGHIEEAVRKEAPGSERQETYSKLLEEVQRLKTIVGKLLLLARADAGQLSLSIAPINFSEALEETCEDTRILAPSLDISAEIEPAVRIDADEALLRQVLQNLCSNAIKYNVKSGKIRFRLRRKDNAAVFTLWNMGKPIPNADRARIFDRFYRVDTARNRKVGGAGLGLSLAREIARAHGGDLTLEPPMDGWVGFRLTLPLATIGRP